MNSAEAETILKADSSNSTANQNEDSEVYEGVQKIFMVDTRVRTAKGSLNGFLLDNEIRLRL